ncbi:hypothetical protein Fot_49554 [Forsythia ovata]|uniref:Uncharacterized protein n=1 Tax=Forsythia ovata TaxID=205694 RepID=A0ABD1QCA8_9LAMI
MVTDQEDSPIQLPLQPPLYRGGATMPTGATPFHSSPCFSAQKPPSGVSSSKPQTNLLTTKPKTLLEKHPLYTPTHTKISLQFKEKILCLEIMGIDFRSSTLPKPISPQRFFAFDP